MQKKCPKCELSKDLDEFYRRKKHRSNEYYEKCKACMKSRGRLYYHQNHDRQLSLAKLRKSKYIKQRKEWLNRLKNKPCVDCGKKFPPYVMDFDHIDSKTKIASISLMAIRNTSNIEKIKTEIEKCDLVCANCHRIRTYDRLHATKVHATVAKLVKAAL